MARLSARGRVEVNARRGWFVVQPSLDEAREAFGARLALEPGLLRGLTGPLPAAALARLKTHIADEQAAIRASDAGERSWLLGDFSVCLAQCAGNPLLAGNLMARNPQLGIECKFVLKDSPNFIGVAKGEDKLRLKVNEIIAGAKASGDLDKMAQKCLGRPAGDLPN